MGWASGLPQGCGNGGEGDAPEIAGGDPESRLWVAVAGRVHGCTNSPAIGEVWRMRFVGIWRWRRGCK
jgi:hypothetical protein